MKEKKGKSEKTVSGRIGFVDGCGQWKNVFGEVLPFLQIVEAVFFWFFGFGREGKKYFGDCDCDVVFLKWGRKNCFWNFFFLKCFCVFLWVCVVIFKSGGDFVVLGRDGVKNPNGWSGLEKLERA